LGGAIDAIVTARFAALWKFGTIVATGAS